MNNVNKQNDDESRKQKGPIDETCRKQHHYHLIKIEFSWYSDTRFLLIPDNYYCKLASGSMVHIIVNKTINLTHQNYGRLFLIFYLFFSTKMTPLVEEKSELKAGL